MRLDQLEILDVVTQGAGPVTRAAIIERTGIPRGTVARLLPGMVKQGYLDKVGHGRFRAGKKLQPASNTAQRGLRADTGKPFLFLGASSWAADEIFLGIHDVLRERRMKCTMHPLGPSFQVNPERDLELLNDVAGVFLFSPRPIPQFVIDAIAECRIPCVHAGYPDHAQCDTVSWNEYAAYRQMTRQLIEKGHEHLIYVGDEFPHANSLAFRQRKEGYEAAMREAGRAPICLLTDMAGYAFSGNREKLGTDFFNNVPDDEKVGLIAAAGDPRLLEVVDSRLREIAGDNKGGFEYCSVCSRSQERESDFLQNDVVLRVYEPWNEVGRVAARQMLSRLQGDDWPPIMTLVKPVISGKPA